MCWNMTVVCRECGHPTKEDVVLTHPKWLHTTDIRRGFHALPTAAQSHLKLQHINIPTAHLEVKVCYAHAYTLAAHQSYMAQQHTKHCPLQPSHLTPQTKKVTSCSPEGQSRLRSHHALRSKAAAAGDSSSSSSGQQCHRHDAARSCAMSATYCSTAASATSSTSVKGLP
jgi:hypothetical protein